MVSVEQMNENFQALVNSNLLRSTSFNCNDGETINGAIESGYNDITVLGTCNENLNFVDWEDSPQLAPRYLKLIGSDSTAKIVDASGGTDSTIFVGAGTTLSVENMTISGGTYGAAAYRNSNLLLSGVTIENFTNRGISVADSSYLGVDDGGVTISGGTDASYGILLSTGASGWIHTSNISNVETGINLWSQSFTYIYNFSIEASNRGISLTSGSTVHMIDGGTGTIEGTSDSAIRVNSTSNFSSYSRTVTIQNLNGGWGLRIYKSDAHIDNLKMLDFNNVGSGWKPALDISINSSLKLES